MWCRISNRARVLLVLGLAASGCSDPHTARIDICARGDRDTLATMLAGGHFEITAMSETGSDVVRVSADRASNASLDLPAGSISLRVDGYDAADTFRAWGETAGTSIASTGACVCLALDAQHAAACAGIGCRVDHDACVFFDEASGAPPGPRSLAFGNNAGDDVRDVASDTYVNRSTGTEGDSYGADPVLHAEGTAADPSQVALLRFELAAIPTVAQISTATLTLESNRHFAPATTPLDLFVVREAWDAGTGTGGAGCPNWTCRRDGATWTVPGCGYINESTRSRDGTAVATTATPAAGATADIDVTTAVAAWVATPDANYGLAMFVEGSDTAKLVSSDETELGATRPRLRVTFQIP